MLGKTEAGARIEVEALLADELGNSYRKKKEKNMGKGSGSGCRGTAIANKEQKWGGKRFFPSKPKKRGGGGG